MPETYTCWKCGSALPDLPVPPGREEECPRCRAQLHVCRMCVFFDPSVAQQCREPVADPVSDKQRANFCGYFQVNPHAYAGAADTASSSRDELDALFGGDSPGAASGERSAEDAARDELEQLFRK